jgi:hypothetical protein
MINQIEQAITTLVEAGVDPERRGVTGGARVVLLALNSLRRQYGEKVYWSKDDISRHWKNNMADVEKFYTGEASSNHPGRSGRYGGWKPWDWADRWKRAIENLLQRGLIDHWGQLRPYSKVEIKITATGRTVADEFRYEWFNKDFSGHYNFAKGREVLDDLNMHPRKDAFSVFINGEEYTVDDALNLITDHRTAEFAKLRDDPNTEVEIRRKV